MKKITFLLMVFAFAWNVPVKADVFPEASKDGKVKWYFLQSIRPQPVAWRSSLTTAAVIAILISS